MAVKKKGGLKRGLDALFEDNVVPFNLDQEENGGNFMVRISSIEPNRNQPRKNFDPEALHDLAESIREHGVLQPLLVRKVPGGIDETYQIVAGERRWRAAQMADLKEVPVVVRDMTEAEVMEFGLVENLQRENLNPIEEASGYRELVEIYGLTQEEVARKVSKSRSSVSNSLRLLTLPQSVQEYLENGKLTIGHAKALLTLFKSEDMVKLANLAVEKKLSVRETEKLSLDIRAEELAGPPQPKPVPKIKRYFTELQIAMHEEMGRRVKINSRGAAEEGMLQIEFFSKEDLEDIVNLLMGLK